MLDDLIQRLYDRLGRHYKLAFVFTQVPASVGVAIAFVFVIASFFDPTAGEVALLAGITSLFTVLGVGYAIARQRQALSDMVEWGTKEKPTPEETIAAWDAAANFPMRSYRRDSLTVNTIAVIPSIALFAVILDLPLVAIPLGLVAASVAALFATVVTYSIAEALIRPPMAAIAEHLPADFTFTRNGLPLRKRLLITLPTFTVTTGLVTAALINQDDGTGAMATSIGVAVLVGLAISHELTLLLSRAITTPIADLGRALQQVTAGDYSVRVPVLSSDDLGELSAAFNRMAGGLAEREQIREAFGTYLDKDVARFILSGRFPQDGVEVDVSIMFCDVPDFTPFAEQASPTQVVARLNALFETIVPIVARHGGHVDKFIGDGLLAVFGAPEGYADHADRAFRAGCEILDAVAASDDLLRVCVGINSGRVVAGSLGGAGRLNFSVIGDAVNVAARVEAATRDFEDDLLITAATRDAMTRPVDLVSRGSIPLKGKSEPIEVLAPPAVAARASRPRRAATA